MDGVKKCRITPRREQRIATVARGIVSGRTQQALAEEFGVSQQQIAKDWSIAITRWRDSELVDVNEVRNKQLAELDAVKHAAWEAWWASLEDREKVVTEQQGDNGTPRVKVEKETKGGDPRYLDVIIRCCEREARLIGLDEPMGVGLSIQGQPITIREVVVELPQENKGD